MENAALRPTHVSHIPTSQLQLLTQFILQTLFDLLYRLLKTYNSGFCLHKYRLERNKGQTSLLCSPI